MKEQFYYFSNNDGMSLVVMTLPDIMAIIESDTADQRDDDNGEADAMEYTITPCYLSPAEIAKLPEANF